MAEEEKEKKEGEEAEAPPKKGKGKLIIIIVVVLLLVGGGAGFFLMKGKEDPAADHAEEAHEEEEHFGTAEIEPFIVNLSENASFLKLKIMIEFNHKVVFKVADEGGGHGGEGGGEGEEKGAGALPGVLAPKTPMIRDAIIKVLSSKRAAEVLSLEGKETLKEELIDAINEASGLDEDPIVNIYFLEFIVQ